MNGRQKILLPAAYGIHHMVNRELRQFFADKVGHSTFFFYEFFLQKPCTRWMDPADALEDEQAVTAPFLSRVINQTGFLPALNSDTLDDIETPADIDVVPLTRSSYRDYWRNIDTMAVKIQDAEVLKTLLLAWYGKVKEDIECPPYYADETDFTPTSSDGIVAVVGSLKADYLREEYPQSIISRVKTDPSFKQTALAKLREFELVLKPWLRSSSVSKVGYVSCSISTKALFWGECIVLFPEVDSESDEELTIWKNKLTGLLRHRIGSTYAPMLTLLENYTYECELRDKIEERITSAQASLPSEFTYRGIGPSWLKVHQDYLQKVGEGKFPSTALEGGLEAEGVKVDHVFVSILSQFSRDPNRWNDNNLTQLERALVELWADRLSILSEGAAIVFESLVFARYLIASPAMVDRICQVIALKHAGGIRKQSKKSGLLSKKLNVKTALIIGGPGSGKDSLARLVRLFSPGFRFGPSTTVNMATFRPKEAAVPLLLGLSTRYNDNDMKVEGVLSQVDKMSKRWWSENSHGKKIEKRVKRGFTFIWDELNSLDIDTQGALLRILENGELVPLGGWAAENGSDGKPRSDLLVIGVMNEDPDRIMKQRVLERVIRDEQLFGGLLGDSLYEMLRSQRRLRDDLYYRLIRGGEVYLPDLRDRREDIPILFHFTVSADLMSLFPEKLRNSYEIDLTAYEALLDPALKWEGNLRELQTVARRVVETALKSHEEASQQDETLVIGGEHVRQTLQYFNERSSGDRRRKGAAGVGE